MSSTQELYVSRAGTLRIAGRTDPVRAGWCAMHFLEQKKFPIDFLCIGGNSTQQAMKAMSFFRIRAIAGTSNIEIAFIPLRFLVKTKCPKTGVMQDRDCTAWRTIVIKVKDNEDEIGNTEISAN